MIPLKERIAIYKIPAIFIANPNRLIVGLATNNRVKLTKEPVLIGCFIALPGVNNDEDQID